jgi:hypothetical protein
VYIRINTTRVDPSREQEFARFTEEQLIPAMRKTPNFRHFYAAHDRTTGRGVGISLWETREQAEGMHGWDEAMGSQIVQGLQSLGVQVEDVQILEVTAEA